MKDSFPEAMAFTFQWEGFDSDIKGDPGGRTRLGVCERYWPADYARIRGMAPDEARAYATEFYRLHFWDFIGCDGLAHPLDVVAFDSAVNPGPGWCRRGLALTRDWERLLELREQHYRQIAHPNVLEGLLHRCRALREKYREV